MSKIFLKYSLIIASLLVFTQIYLTINQYQQKQEDINDLKKISDIQKVLIDLRFNGGDYMAIAGVIDDSNTYAYGYTSKHRTQKSANKRALAYCEKERKRIGIEKKCIIMNSLLEVNLLNNRG